MPLPIKISKQASTSLFQLDHYLDVNFILSEKVNYTFRSVCVCVCVCVCVNSHITIIFLPVAHKNLW